MYRPIQSFLFLILSGIVLGELVSHDPNDIHFYLYPDFTNTSYREEIVYRNSTTLLASKFQPLQYTVLVSHGLHALGSPDLMQDIKNAYLSSNISGNIVLVDWYNLSTPNVIQNFEAVGYLEVVTNVPVAARRVSDFVQWLQQQGVLSTNQLHLVGHSLGAHVSGQAGLNLINMNNGTKPARITGLDPAGPLFWPPIAARNLNRNDAKFVDVIHTNAGLLGDVTTDGHVDFYVNGGSRQPNCNDLASFPPGFCSHVYSIAIFAASINTTFTGCQCENYNSCVKPERLGQYCSTSAQGRYCLKASNPPN